ncbi:hypothetical protein SRHO_G00263240 [Serrasalmus rhombeus]
MHLVLRKTLRKMKTGRGGKKPDKQSPAKPDWADFEDRQVLGDLIPGRDEKCTFLRHFPAVSNDGLNHQTLFSYPCVEDKVPWPWASSRARGDVALGQ